MTTDRLSYTKGPIMHYFLQSYSQKNWYQTRIAFTVLYNILARACTPTEVLTLNGNETNPLPLPNTCTAHLPGSVVAGQPLQVGRW